VCEKPVEFFLDSSDMFPALNPSAFHCNMPRIHILAIYTLQHAQSMELVAVR
jgi:hypothetical protein